MRELHGEAEAVVPVAREECVSFLAAVEAYPEWYPQTVRAVKVLERDTRGNPTKVSARLHVAHGPLVKDFDMSLAVEVEPPGTVTLERIAHDHSDQERFQVTWRVDDASRVGLELDANLSIPRLVPVGGIADSLARGFVEAAVRALGRADR